MRMTDDGQHGVKEVVELWRLTAELTMPTVTKEEERKELVLIDRNI